jgi:hypothetical protein
MQPVAKVNSIEALDAFKASLVIYLEKAGRILDDLSDDVVRTRIWLQTDRQLHWKKQVHLRGRELAQAEQELLTARLSGLHEAVKARRMAVNKAAIALREAEAGLARVKQWMQGYETLVESRTKVIARLRHLLASDLHKAVAFLENAATTLDAYAGTTTPSRESLTEAPGPAAGQAPARDADDDEPAAGGDAR